jgi:splicing factor 3A subunit 1
VCPKCGQEIPVDQMEEHMKIELLDPKYRIQRQAMMERTKGSPLAGDDDIARNLGAFARRRTDIFGDQEVEIGKSVGDEKEHKKADDKAIWDGHTASIQRTTTAAVNKSFEEHAAPNKGTAPR